MFYYCIHKHTEDSIQPELAWSKDVCFDIYMKFQRIRKVLKSICPIIISILNELTVFI